MNDGRTYPLAKTDEQWREELSAAEYDVLRRAATEPPGITAPLAVGARGDDPLHRQAGTDGVRRQDLDPLEQFEQRRAAVPGRRGGAFDHIVPMQSGQRYGHQRNR